MSIYSLPRKWTGWIKWDPLTSIMPGFERRLFTGSLLRPLPPDVAGPFNIVLTSLASVLLSFRTPGAVVGMPSSCSPVPTSGDTSLSSPMGVAAGISLSPWHSRAGSVHALLAFGFASCDDRGSEPESVSAHSLWPPPTPLGVNPSMLSSLSKYGHRPVPGVVGFSVLCAFSIYKTSTRAHQPSSLEEKYPHKQRGSDNTLQIQVLSKL